MFHENAQITSIHKEFIRNLDGILQNDFHLKSFEKTKYIFEQSISDVMVILMIGFKILRLYILCGIWNLYREKLYPL